jgi:hypothetical protein
MLLDSNSPTKTIAHNAAKNHFYYNSTEILEWLSSRDCDFSNINEDNNNSVLLSYMKEHTEENSGLTYSLQVLRYLAGKCDVNH